MIACMPVWLLLSLFWKYAILKPIRRKTFPPSVNDKSGDMARTDKQVDFFISYADEDQQWAEWIAWQLEEAGYTTFLQHRDVHPGSNFLLVIDEALSQARRVIAVLSPAYLSSRFTFSGWTATVRYD